MSHAINLTLDRAHNRYHIPFINQFINSDFKFFCGSFKKKIQLRFIINLIAATNQKLPHKTKLPHMDRFFHIKITKNAMKKLSN